MGKTKELSREKRAQIQILRQEGHTTTAIATRMQCSQGCVVKTLKRINDTGNYLSKSRSGRRKVTSRRTDILIRRHSNANPFACAREISHDVYPEPHVGPAASLRTIRRRLCDDFGLPSRKPARKPRLSAKNIRDRLAFCRKYRHWTVQQWETVMFSDESTVEQFGQHVQYVRRPISQRYNPKYVLPTVKQAPKVMIWGAITANMRCGLWFMPANTTINARVYLDVLQQKLPIFRNITRTTIFQHDGAPCHTAKLVSKWLYDNGIEVLGPWPGNSPDLNPIENCWNYLKDRVARLNPSSIDDLKHKIKLVWTQEIKQEYLKKLIHSMPRRLQACLKANGAHSKY